MLAVQTRVGAAEMPPRFTAWMVCWDRDKSSLEEVKNASVQIHIFRSVMKFQNIILWKRSEKERCSGMHNSLCVNKDKTVIEICH